MAQAQILILGGGLAGMASAAALGQAGYDVTVLEARAFPGGRATSYSIPSDPDGEVIDNCQHVLLRCCVNLLDFYRRLGVSEKVEFHREFFFIEPGGRFSVLKAGLLPTPLHFSESFLRLTFLSLCDKIAIGKALLAVKNEYHRRKDLDRITMLEWLQEKGQTGRAIERFWRQVLVSAINEELDRMAAIHGLQVFWLGFLARKDCYEMGLPAVPLAELYSPQCWQAFPNVRFEYRAPVTAIESGDSAIVAVTAGDRRWTADHYISALPFERLSVLLPQFHCDFGHSPITGIHLWFDRPVTSLPHGTLLDRTIQWFFNKDRGRYLQLVVSASRSLVELSRQEVIDLALKELAEFLPDVRLAKLTKAHVVKEVRATFSAQPNLEQKRPPAVTTWKNFSLAGDWTRSGWPATMEGAVRSGYLAAEATTQSLGQPTAFLLPDIA